MKSKILRGLVILLFSFAIFYCSGASALSCLGAAIFALLAFAITS